MLLSIDTLLCATPAGQPLPMLGKTSPKLGKTLGKLGKVREQPARWVLPDSDRRPDGLKLRSKEAVMVDLVLRPQGASRPELREALGWKSDPYPSLVVACDKAGVVLTRHGAEPVRYRGLYQVGGR